MARLSRRALLGTAAAASLIRPAAAQTTGVTPIFIRWDAWYSTVGSVTPYQNALSPQRWQSRAPWFSEVVSPHRVISEGTQANMDLEILAAQNAGIKAWAFDWYSPGTGSPPQPPGSVGLSAGWNLFNTSPNKSLIKWCLALEGAKNLGYAPWSNTAGWHANVDQLVGLLQQSNYLKVLGRPVVFCRWQAPDVATYFAGSNANVTTAFNYLRTQCAAVPGLGDPYIIAMGSPYDSTVSSSVIKPIITADAISNYIPNIAYTSLPNTAADLFTRTSSWWASQLATGNKMVPNAVLGFDNRPLGQLPPFASGRTPWFGNDAYYTLPTPAQSAAHLQSCIDFIGANVAACESKMMLVYAWSENAEGGVVGMPTIGDPPTGSPPTTNLLSAIKPVLTAAA